MRRPASSTAPPIGPWTSLDEEIAAAIRRKEASRDAEFFAHRYLRHERWRWLREFDAALEEKGVRIKVLQAPVDQGKSTRLTAHVARRICRDRGVRIGYLMRTKSLARDRVRSVRDILLRNKLVVRDWWDPEHGPFFANEWEAGEGGKFNVRGARPIEGVSSSTLTAYGILENYEGEKWHLAVLDDVANRRAMSSAADRAAIWNAIESTVVNRVEPGGEIWIVGAPWHEDDHYARAVAVLGAKLYRWDSVLQDSGLGVHPEGHPFAGRPILRPLTPERFGIDGVGLLERGYGTAMFNLKWRCNVKAFSGGVFQAPLQWITLEQCIERGGFESWGMGFDPNNSEEEDSDFTAIASIARLRDGTPVFVRGFQAHRKSGWQHDIAREYDAVQESLRIRRFMGVRMEANQFQDEIRRNLFRERPDIKAFPVHRHQNKVERLSTRLDGYFNAPDRFYVLRGAPCAQDLVDAARAFPYGTFDLLDAVEAALLNWDGAPARRRVRVG